MSKSSSIINFTHFADDTSVFLSSNDINYLTCKMNLELVNVNNWLMSNRLSLNVDKTKYMIVTNKNLTNTDIIVKIAGRIINRTTSTKFLGIVIDDKLNYNEHVSSITRQASVVLGRIRSLSCFTPMSVRLNIFYALIYSKVSYGILAFGRSNVSNVNRLGSVIERSWRAIRSYDCNNIDNFLSYDSIYQYNAAIKLYKTLNCNDGNLHEYFNERINTPEHAYFTRFNAGNNLSIPLFTISKCHKSFLYQSILVWNSLPDTIKSINFLMSFKKQLKRYLLLKQPNFT